MVVGSGIGGRVLHSVCPDRSGKNGAVGKENDDGYGDGRTQANGVQKLCYSSELAGNDGEYVEAARRVHGRQREECSRI
jgi:hypothetical protein